MPCFLDDCAIAERDPGIIFARFSVPESRERDDSRTLQLGVAILPARSSDRRPDPIIYLAGGPGVSALHSIEYFADHYLRENRDIILFDARGVGYSEPDLCPGLGASFLAMLAAGQATDVEAAVKLNHYETCYGELVRAGIDLGGYNSVTIAADVEELRQALGHAQWNLYGISYGTRYALTILREAPAGVRSVILDSVVPLGTFHVTATTANYGRALEAYFAACERNSSCSRRFPDLHQRFLRAGRTLEKSPLTVELGSGSGVPGDRFVVDMQDMHLAVQQILYDNEFYPVLPLLIEVFERRDRAVLARLLPSLSRALNKYSFAHAMLVNRYDNGMYLDQVPDSDPELARGLTYLETDVIALGAWQSKVGGELEVMPVRSDIPTLVLAGDMDPITPPGYSEYAAQFLSRGRYLLFSGVGHGVSRSGPCPASVVKAFVDDPDTEPDTRCIAATGPMRFFTDARVNGHVAGLAIALFQDGSLSVIIPLGLCLLILLSALLAALWSIVARARGGVAVDRTGLERVARTLAPLGALCGLGFMASLLYFIARTAAEHNYLLLFGLLGSADIIFVLPYVFAAVSLAVTALAIWAWRQSWATQLWRIHYTLTAGAHLGVLALIATYRLW